jgi:N-acetylglucosamine-6-phosphate deacetylase
MHTLNARTLITAIGTVSYPVITVGADGLIEDISTDASIRSDAILTPTFFDVHIHGAMGHDVMDANPEGLHAMQRFLLRHGTGQYLPTTVTASVESTLAALDRIADSIEQPARDDEAMPLGIHLEGPFLSHAKRGVHTSELLQKPSVDLFERFQQAARGHIRLLTLAPELDGADELIRHASASGMRVSMGHTNALAKDARAAIAAGATSTTHTYNAMRPLDHREPGVLGVVLDEAALYAELICDGVHVAPELVRLWLRVKGEQALLITDGISATGMGDGHYALGPLAVDVHGDRCTLAGAPATLAGSVLTLDRAVANLMRFTGCTLETAVRCASSQPARMLGLDASIASLRQGQPASFNQYDALGNLTATYLRGKAISA